MCQGNHTVTSLCVFIENRIKVNWNRGSDTQFLDLFRRTFHEKLIGTLVIKIILSDDTHALKLSFKFKSSKNSNIIL